MLDAMLNGHSLSELHAIKEMKDELPLYKGMFCTIESLAKHVCYLSFFLLMSNSVKYVTKLNLIDHLQQCMDPAAVKRQIVIHEFLYDTTCYPWSNKHWFRLFTGVENSNACFLLWQFTPANLFFLCTMSNYSFIMDKQ